MATLPCSTPSRRNAASIPIAWWPQPGHPWPIIWPWPTLLDPGDEVLIEQPTYELLTSTLLYLGAKVKIFVRDEDNGYALDPAEVRRAITPKTRLIVLTNLHNPSSVLAPDSVLREIGELACSIGARVLVDEVYLDAVYTNTPKTAYLLGPEFIVTSSLTKVYGLSGLRCGWILAEPDLARAMWRLNDLFASIPAHPAELLSVVALEHLDRIRERARKIVEADRALTQRLPVETGRHLFSPHRIWHDSHSATDKRQRG